jgi:ABC-type polar amino acid transport system ATPase subunit
LICGISGSGKTTLLKQKVEYLKRRGKHIYLFDLQGDLHVEGEHCVEFTAWNSEYGINPYEFGTGVKEEELREIIAGAAIDDNTMSILRNSGPSVQVLEMIDIIKKNFMTSMGTNQEPILKRLLLDTYKMKGILFDDYTTWLNPLPALEDTKTLIDQIQNAFELVASGVDKGALKAIKQIVKIIEKGVDKGDFAEMKEEDEIIAAETAKKARAALDKYVIAKVKNSPEDDDDDFFVRHGIDPSFYMRKDVIRVVGKLGFYIDALVESGVFHSTKPSFKAGLNRIDISGLRHETQRFMADVFLGRVFRACKIRGEYAKLSPEKRKRGDKCDTFIIIDETKLIVPNGKEKNDPFSYLNRIATESRKYGLGLIVVAQTSVHFPDEFLRNFYMQIVLTTNKADFDNTRKNFGIAKEQLAMVNEFGVALIKNRVGFSPVKLPWHKSQSNQGA